MRVDRITLSASCCLALASSSCLLLAEPPIVIASSDKDGPETGWVDLAVAYGDLCAIDELGRMWCGSPGSLYLEDEGPFVSISGGSGFGICGVYDSGLLRCGFAEPDTFDLPETYVAVSGTMDAGCGLQASGDVRCWPENASATGPFDAIGAGDRFACGIKPAGTLRCWSIDGLVFDEPLAEIPTGGFSRVTTGDSVGCAIYASSGGISCWGYDFYGIETGPPSDSYVDLSIALAGACAVSVSGSIACWGDDASDPNNAEFFPPAGESFSRVAIGAGIGCGITTDTRLVCWD